MTKDSLKYVLYLFIALCGAMMTALFTSLRVFTAKELAVSLLVSFFVFAYLCVKKGWPSVLLSQGGMYPGIVSFILACTALKVYYPLICDNCGEESLLLTTLHRVGFAWITPFELKFVLSFSLVIAGSLVLLWFVRWFSGFAKDFMRSLNRSERVFMIISVAVFTVLLAAAYMCTSALYYPIYLDGDFVYYDVLFSSDAGAFIHGDTFSIITAPENDIRNILFGLVNMPFGLVAHLLGFAFFFLPFSYAYFIALIQGVLALSAIVMLGQMVEPDGKHRLPFLLISLFSFPMLLNLFNIEQYSLSVFWVIILVYSYILKRDGRTLYYMGAAGSLVTSGVLLPLITEPCHASPKEMLKDLGKAILVALATFSVFGFVPYFLHELVPELIYWVEFSVGATMTSRLLQFFTLVYSIFLFPESGEGMLRRIYDSFGEFAVYDVYPITSINYIGCFLFALAILGFVFNRKDSYARICLGWLLLSVFVLIIMGWGAAWNCMTLYGFYFSWAYISLIYLSIKKLLQSYPKQWQLFLYICAAVILVLNAIKMADVLRFALENYPV